MCVRTGAPELVSEWPLEGVPVEAVRLVRVRTGVAGGVEPVEPVDGLTPVLAPLVRVRGAEEPTSPDPEPTATPVLEEWEPLVAVRGALPTCATGVEPPAAPVAPAPAAEAPP